MRKHELLKWVEAHENQEDIMDLLDNTVHDIKSLEASNINNSGLDNQIRYLLQSDRPYSLNELKRMIDEYLKAKEDFDMD